MNTKQLILKSAIGVFAFSTILSGCVMVFGQKKPNYFNITIPASAARLAFGLGMLGTGLTMLLASGIEAVETGDLLKPKRMFEKFWANIIRYYTKLSLPPWTNEKLRFFNPRRWVLSM